MLQLVHQAEPRLQLKGSIEPVDQSDSHEAITEPGTGELSIPDFEREAAVSGGGAMVEAQIVPQMAQWLMNVSDQAVSKDDAYKMAFTTATNVHVAYQRQVEEQKRSLER